MKQKILSIWNELSKPKQGVVIAIVIIIVLVIVL